MSLLFEMIPQLRVLSTEVVPLSQDSFQGGAGRVRSFGMTDEDLSNRNRRAHDRVVAAGDRGGGRETRGRG